MSNLNFKQNIGEKLLKWYQKHGRDLPFRKTKDPYKIWICEIVFQQTRIQQGIGHYNNFVKRFPNVKSLANAETDEVLLYWKGLGYYSRALNLHKAANQIMNDFEGNFPENYDDILNLQGVGKYTAAAISSICFDAETPAVDGNFYRVLSRLFSDDYDISKSNAFEYFSQISLELIPKGKAGNFNQAMMDLGSEICKPKNPDCENCPINEDCLAFEFDRINEFPVKTKRTKVENLELNYYFIYLKNQFLIQQRGDDFIWKKLFEFPSEVSSVLKQKVKKSTTIKHKLSHKNVELTIFQIPIDSEKELLKLSEKYDLMISDSELFHQKSFPKPLENFLNSFFES